MRIVTVLGIRPDWIAMSRLIPLLDEMFEHTIIHCEQHYDWTLNGQFFQELSIRRPDYFLGVKSGSQPYQTGTIIEKAGQVMEKLKPDLMISFSDANPAMAAIAASKLGIKVLHLEAGLRSNDWRMPEEKNRRVIDSISDYLFPPTEDGIKNLSHEGVSMRKVIPTSKIVLDAIDFYYRSLEKQKNNLGDFILVTLHRPETVSNPSILQGITQGITLFRDDMIPNARIIAPLHPRTIEALRTNGEARRNTATWEIKSPLGFLDFTWLEDHAQIVFTDSGTVQEDTCHLGTKCVTCRISTERPETLGLNNWLVAPHGPDHLTAINVLDAGKLVWGFGGWTSPYKLGSSKQIADWIGEHDDDIKTPKVRWDD